MRSIRLTTAAALLALAAGAAPAAAADSAEGRCTLTGETIFDTPIGNEPRQVEYRDKASGTCSGTLNGEPIENEPVVMRGRGSGTIGCLAGKTDGFAGRITYTRGTEDESDDVSFGFTAHSVGAGAQFVAAIQLENGGHGVGHVDYFPRSPDSDLADRCAAGTVDRVPYTLTAQTFAAPAVP